MAETLNGFEKISFKKILVVEDELGLRQVLKILLESKNYEVVLAEDGEKGLKFGLNDDDIDLVITDVKLPKLNGLDLLKKLIKQKKDLTIIVMSAYGSIDMAVESMKAGAYHFLTKPFKKDVLIHVISKAEERFQLISENKILKEKLKGGVKIKGIIGKSQVITDILVKLKRVAKFKSTVLITGESGTGKELIARGIHSFSDGTPPFIAVNCGAIPESLMESELFGYMKGTFTGAVNDKTGLFEEAHKGTLFLDEIGELPLNLQVKLLRVLQDGKIRPLGSTIEKEVDVRIIAATSRDLKQEVKNSTFREDLYYRLNVVPVELPSLRERVVDIPLLVEHFLEKAAVKFGIDKKSISHKAILKMQRYAWPGNIRELENLIERLTILVEHDEIDEKDLLFENQDNFKLSDKILAENVFSVKKTMQVVEKILIKRALEKTGGKKGKAADLLEISKRALLYKMKEYDLKVK
jgi:two-component system, NtrC family, response regulator AtoC